MSRKLSIATVAGAALVGVAGLHTVAVADSTTSISLSANVADACSFGTVTNVSFANDYQPGQSGTLSGGGSFVVNCTVANQTITLTPNGGGNAGGAFGRQLVHATNTNELLGYSLLVSDTNGASATNAFDDAVGFAPPTALATGDSTFLVEALIAGSQTVIGGAYSDSVDVVMSF